MIKTVLQGLGCLTTDVSCVDMFFTNAKKSLNLGLMSMFRLRFRSVTDKPSSRLSRWKIIDIRSAASFALVPFESVSPRDLMTSENPRLAWIQYPATVRSSRSLSMV